MEKSKIGRMNGSDWKKTLIMFILSTLLGSVTGVLTEYLNAIQSGNPFNLTNALVIAAIGAGITILTYISKNVFSNSNDQFMKKEYKNAA